MNQIFRQRISAGRAIDWGILFAITICLGIIAMGTWLMRYELEIAPIGEGFHYEWQLAAPSFWSRATVWLGFGIHQLLIWYTIYYATQKNRQRYTDELKPVNYWALAINAVFVVLHYVQTMFFYDGIAQDIPSWTAQFAVIMMLYIILTLENRRRGLFFGRKINLRKEFYNWIRDYHGYAFSFAVIYTFWFHPMVPTWGHLLGFAQVILVMVQGSLMFTRAHLNKRWILLNEILVLPHAALVAINQGHGLVYMFAFGFIVIFLVTQMHGLGLKPWVKTMFYASFLIVVLIVYTVIREPFQINEVIRIPAIEYLLIFVTYWLWLLVARLTGRIDRFRTTPEQPQPGIAAGD